MNRSKALRFLILKHLWRYKKSVSPDFFKEITKTLVIDNYSNDTSSWNIYWLESGVKKIEVIPKSKINFYKKSDFEGSKGADQTSHKEGELYFKQLALKMLNLYKEEDFKVRHNNIFGGDQILSILIIFSFSVIFFSNEYLNPTSNPSLFFLFFPFLLAVITEYWLFKGKLLLIFYGTLLLLSNFLLITLMFNFQLLILSFLDPDSKLRNFRVLCHSILTFSGLLLLDYHTISFDYIQIPIFFTSIYCVFLIWLTGTHFFFMPMITPLIIFSFSFYNLNYDSLFVILFLILALYVQNALIKFNK